MTDAFSGLFQKASDKMSSLTSGDGGVPQPDMSQYQSQGGDQQQGGSDTQDMMKGLKDTEASYKDFNKAEHGLQNVKDKNKKISFKKLFKSALGFGEAARKAEEAGEQFSKGVTGQGSS